jgi:hypothetical protein
MRTIYVPSRQFGRLAIAASSVGAAASVIGCVLMGRETRSAVLVLMAFVTIVGFGLTMSRHATAKGGETAAEEPPEGSAGPTGEGVA